MGFGKWIKSKADDAHTATIQTIKDIGVATGHEDIANHVANAAAATYEATRHVRGFQVGVLEAGYELAEGTVVLVGKTGQYSIDNSVIGMVGDYYTSQGEVPSWLSPELIPSAKRGNESTETIVKTGGALGQIAVDNSALGDVGDAVKYLSGSDVPDWVPSAERGREGAKALTEAMFSGIIDDWNNGNYGEAVGRGVFEVVTLIGTGGVGAVTKTSKITKLSKVLGALDDVKDFSKAGGAAIDAAKSTKSLDELFAAGQKVGKVDDLLDLNKLSKAELDDLLKSKRITDDQHAKALTRLEEAADAGADGTKVSGTTNKADNVENNKEKDAEKKPENDEKTGSGDPIDVATGDVFVDTVDYTGFGVLPFVFKRDYTSSCEVVSALGYGWSHSYDYGLVEMEDSIKVYLPGNRIVAFENSDEEGEIFHRKEKAYLRKEDTLFLFKKKGLTYYFDRSQKNNEGKILLSKIINRNGIEKHFQYNDQGLLNVVTDGGGRDHHFSYNAAGFISEIHAPHPSDKAKQLKILAYGYDQDSNLTRITDAHGKSRTYGYKNHLLSKSTDKTGLSFYWEYDGEDAMAWCVKSWGDGNLYYREFIYHKKKGITYEVDSLGFKKTYYWNGDGLVDSIEDSRGGTHEYELNEYNETLSTKDPLGRITRYEYDDLGNLTAITTPDAGRTEFTYEGENLVAYTNADGDTWQMVYDEQGRVISQLNPLGEETQFIYGEYFLESTVAPNGAKTTLSYDSYGNPTALTLPNGAKSRWEYDRMGRCTVATTSTGAKQVLEFDAMHRVTKVQEPDDNVRCAEYDLEGNVTRVSDKLTEVSFTYSGLRKLTSRVQDGKTVHFSYDTEEQLIEIKNEAQSVYQFTLDGMGDLIQEKSFDGLTRKYDRDLAGQIISVERPHERNTTYQYDPNGRVVEAHYGSDAFENLEYSEGGQLIRAKNQSGEIYIERDSLGRVLEEIQNGMSVKSTYDSSGFRSLVTSSLGVELELERDLMGEVSSVKASLAEARWQANFERDALGLEIVRNLPGGARNVWKRDKLGRPIQNEIHGPAKVLRERTYHWGVDHRLDSIKDNRGGTVSFNYDKRGFLTATNLPGGEVEHRMPDAIGNLYKTVDCSDRKYGASGQLLREKTSEGWTQYEYDQEGNLTKKTQADGQVWHYEWNAAGFMTKVIRPDAEEVSFTYDAFGRRLTKSYQGEKTCFLWDGNVMLHEWVEQELPPPPKVIKMLRPDDMEGEAQRRLLEQMVAHAPAHGPPSEQAEITTWVYEPESFIPMAKLVGDQSYSILTDHLGTPIEMLDQSGESVWSASRIDSFGLLQELRGKRDACPFRWQGQYVDVETNLYYNRFRYYDPEAGQYVSQDPIGLAGGNPTLYGYVGDCNTSSDPLGLLEHVTFPAHQVIAETTIDLRGSRTWDYRAANANVGLNGARGNPTIWAHTATHGDVVWHHVDYDPVTNKAKMQLVSIDDHKATLPHRGSVADFEAHTGTIYETPEAKARAKAINKARKRAEKAERKQKSIDKKKNAK